MRFRKPRRDVIVVLQILALAAAIYLTSQIGLVIGLGQGRTSPFWPPTGVAVVALLAFGIDLWPGILLGSAIVEMFTGPVIVAIPTAFGTTLACVCAYWALRKVGFRVELDRLKDALALVFLGAFAAMLISSTVGTTLLLYTGVVSIDTFLPTWLTWWTGDAMGVLVVAPFLLTMVKLPWRRYHDIDSVRLVEFVALLVITFGLMLVAEKALGVIFVAFPLLVWAAWRFQLPGAAPVGLLASAMAIHAAVVGYGTFDGRNQSDTMMILQLFNGSVALTGLLLSVAVTERRRMQAELERACGQLGQVIERIDRAMRPDEPSRLRRWAEDRTTSK
ncbi:MASE1 domain-containing protein [Actinopolymorpha singaporensis]|uniref:Integral membrane sensor domain MASE1 n=1 Tax=Actinopolymorpha singaporensis TaxID=117157 RepID=A0A1H1R444_9ACTN|nr:MASE1 domain-containing protein [Actinopolymorpha singaporensis]SDS30420.1 Integral membrane sensor domain MASE1 [Actinopolymorpha singaporensis]